MNVKQLSANILAALILASSMIVGAPLKAEEAGFTLEDSIRTQIFMELKSNVKNLYLNSQRVVPSIDTSTAAKIAGRSQNIGFSLPINNAAGFGKEENSVENIN